MVFFDTTSRKRRPCFVSMGKTGARTGQCSLAQGTRLQLRQLSPGRLWRERDGAVMTTRQVAARVERQATSRRRPLGAATLLCVVPTTELVLRRSLFRRG